MSYLNTDVPELKGFDTGTVLGNIELLEGRLEGMLEATVAEIAERYGMRENSVTVLLHRTRKKLKAHLQKEGFDL